MEVSKTLTPAWSLRRRTRLVLSRLMDASTHRVLDSGLTADWKGLADLMGFDNIDIQNFEKYELPTYEILNHWDKHEDATVEKLMEFLRELQRADAIEEVKHLIADDLTEFSKKHRPLQDCTVSDASSNSLQSERLTVLDGDRCDDSSQFGSYDAYVCVADNDLEFVTDQLIPRLEGDPYNYRLFVEMRDMLPGVPQYTASAHMIAQRCNKVLIILSPEFLSSKKCEWILQYAHSVTMDSVSRSKLIPVVISTCKLPDILRGLNVINLTASSNKSGSSSSASSEIKQWAWRRLAMACCAPAAAAASNSKA